MGKIIKLLFIFLVALNSINASSVEVHRHIVSNYQIPPMFDYSLDLELSNKPQRLFLDCQSFFHEIVLYNPEYVFETAPPQDLRVYSRDINEENCFQLAEFIVHNNDNNRSVCLVHELDKNEIFISDNENDCL
jgi:hypothetical protein